MKRAFDIAVSLLGLLLLSPVLAVAMLAIRLESAGSPIFAQRAGTVNKVKSAGLQSGTSSQVSGVETRASGSGRTEYAEHVVRSFAFWL